MKTNTCLKLLLVCSVSLLFGLFSCTTTVNKNQPTNETTTEEPVVTETQIDSIALALHELDSIMNSGQLVHLDVYELGKLKSVSVSVQKITSVDHSLTYINFRKDCGGEYYYSWEDARLLTEECPYFLDAMNVIIENKTREVDHEERYAYITKDNMRLFSTANPGKKWNIELSVDYRKQNSTVTMSDKELEELRDLIIKGQQKIEEIQ
jgi:hypothetical protein